MLLYRPPTDYEGTNPPRTTVTLGTDRPPLWARALLELARLVAFALVATIVHLALTMEIPL